MQSGYASPHEVVHREDNVRLLYFSPAEQRKARTPVLIIYALVNRPYILDLQEDRSMVGSLREQGFSVYLLDWGYPGRRHMFLTLNDYINGYVDRAVDVVMDREGVRKVTLLGVCQGGTFAVIYAALHPEKVKNLVTFGAPINFDTDKGLLHIWARKLDVDKLVDTYGNVPGEYLNWIFLLMDPPRLLVDKYKTFFERLGDASYVETFLRMEKWIFDSPAQPGEVFRQFVKDLYQENKLIKNELMLNGQRVDLKRINMPLLNVIGLSDHLVPREASEPLNNAVSSKDKEVLSFPSGHVGLLVSSKSRERVFPRIGDWLRARE